LQTILADRSTTALVDGTCPVHSEDPENLMSMSYPSCFATEKGDKDPDIYRYRCIYIFAYLLLAAAMIGLGVAAMAVEKSPPPAS
jgi:hypothetical protein